MSVSRSKVDKELAELRSIASRAADQLEWQEQVIDALVAELCPNHSPGCEDCRVNKVSEGMGLG